MQLNRDLLYFELRKKSIKNPLFQKIMRAGRVNRKDQKTLKWPKFTQNRCFTLKIDEKR